MSFEDLKRLAVAAERREFQILAADDFEKPVAALEYRRRSCHAARRELCRKQRIAICVRIGAALPLRNIADPRLIQRNVPGNHDIDRFDNLRLRQPEYPRRADHAGNSAYRCVIDAAQLVVPGVADSAIHFIGQCGRHDEFAPAGGGHFSCREQRGYAVAGMPSPLGDIAVVEIQIAHRDVIGERGKINARLPAAAQYGGRPTAGDEPRQLPRDARRFAVKTAECATYRVDDGAFYLMNDLRRKILIFQSSSVGAQIFSYGRHDSPLYDSS